MVYIRDDSDKLFIEVSAVGICSLKFKVAATWANDFILEPLFQPLKVRSASLNQNG